MNFDGTNLTKITDRSGSIMHFSWSPDGQTLVFDSDRDGDFEIYTIKADGTELTQITSNSFYESDPDWSPDGIEIAYVSLDSGDYRIYLMNADGSSIRPLVDGRTPAWSPDGSSIAFSRIDDGIYLIDTDCCHLYRLTDSSQHGWDHYPVWSPDGSLTLFGSNLHQPEWSAAESVYVMGTDGSGISSLSEVWGMPPYAWSPDGHWIIYTQSFGTDAKLYIMDNQGFNVRPLMEENEGIHPFWRH
jgi:TolB protein